MTNLLRTPKLSMLDLERFRDGWPPGKFSQKACEWGQNTLERLVLVCGDNHHSVTSAKWCMGVTVIVTPIHHLTNSWNDDWPHKPSKVFLACFVLTRAAWENFLRGHLSLNYSRSNTLNFGVLKRWTAENKIHLIGIGVTHQSIYIIFNYIISYLHCLRIIILDLS